MLMNSPLKLIACVTLVSLAVTPAYLFSQEQKAGKAKEAQKTAAFPGCNLQHEPGFRKSWAGQPGIPDHTESWSIRKGDYLACLAFANQNSPVPPACYLSYQNDGQYTLPVRNAMTSPSSDIVTLTCNGQNPTCCKVQTNNALAKLKKSEPDLKVVNSEDIRAKK